jgi:hypothetical protein
MIIQTPSSIEVFMNSGDVTVINKINLVAFQTNNEGKNPGDKIEKFDPNDFHVLLVFENVESLKVVQNALNRIEKFFEENKNAS